MASPDRLDRRTPLLWLALAFVVCILAFAGLFPFEFSVRNAVRWSPDGLGLDFRARSIAFSEGPLRWPAGDALSLEVWIEPEEPPTRRLGAIASLYDGSSPPPLLIAQWKGNLVVRLREPGARLGSGSHREIGFRDVLPPRERRHLAIVSGPGGTHVYVDGREAPSYVSGQIVPENSALSAELVLGNSAAATEPWSGRILGLALFARALPLSEIRAHGQDFERSGLRHLEPLSGLIGLYAFDEGRGARSSSGVPGPTIAMEAALRPLEWIVLTPASDFFTGQARDLVLNVLGFVPFGFLVVLLARGGGGRQWRVLLLATGAGAVASLGIEIAQVWLPSRVSSSIDLLCNTAGSALGGLLALPWLRPLRSTSSALAQRDPYAE